MYASDKVGALFGHCGRIRAMYVRHRLNNKVATVGVLDDLSRGLVSRYLGVVGSTLIKRPYHGQA